MDNPSSTDDNGPSGPHDPREAQPTRSFIHDAMALDVGDDRIVTRAPAEPFRLTFLDATCLVINRTIGTGVFSGPQEVMKGVRSPGVAILMWCLGCVYGLVGSHVYVEYGLNVPRYVISGVEQSVPRSGGELHYLQYVFQWPRYRKGTVMLSCVMFGICFICIGNMASNCIDCALRILQAANPDKSALDLNKGSVYGIAVAIATVTCFIHAFSRRGGIVLNNILAFLKVFMIIAMIVCTWVVAGGWSGIRGLHQDNNVFQNEGIEPESGASGYGQAFIIVVFAYFGFYQPSYVLGETQNPRKNLPRSIWWGMGIISVLYIAVNICYMIIVPANVQIQGNVAQEFFRRIVDDDRRGNQTFNAFLAISSFGNIVVWTFTAARMKQEIAKQCFIPFAGFFAKNRDFSFGRFLAWIESKRGKKFDFINPQNHREKTPVGALVLHLATCIALLMATYGASPTNAYIILSKIFTYILAGWFGSFLSIGILLLHFKGPPATQPIRTPNSDQVPDQQPVQKSWREMTEGTVNPKVGIICATLYLIGNIFLITMTWVPPSPSRVSEGTSWYVVPLAAWCVLIFSALWYVGFCTIAKYLGRSRKAEFIIETQLQFDWAMDSREDLESHDRYESSRRYRGGRILVRESIYRRWRPEETKTLATRANSNAGGSTAMEQTGHDGPPTLSGAGYEVTDFDLSGRR